MNSRALNEWFRIRTCARAQSEIRDLATKMMVLCKKAAPDLFMNAGPSCVEHGFCPELEQCEERKGIVPTYAQYEKFRKENPKYEDFVKELMNS
jgi:thymidylate synthase (FAD)